MMLELDEAMEQAWINYFGARILEINLGFKYYYRVVHCLAISTQTTIILSTTLNSFVRDAILETLAICMC